MHKLKLLKLLADNRASAPRAESLIVEGDKETTVYIYEPIVSDPLMAEYYGGVTAVDLVPKIAAIKSETIHLRIDSPGGDVFAAQSICQALRESPANVIAHVDGLAASAATIIACAADKVIMAKGANYMIHNAWSIAIGDANDMTKTAELLRGIDGTIAESYSEKTKIGVDDLRAMMDEETWFTAAQAVEKGFADEVAEAKPKANARAWDLSAYEHGNDKTPLKEESPRVSLAHERDHAARRARYYETA